MCCELGPSGRDGDEFHRIKRNGVKEEAMNVWEGRIRDDPWLSSWNYCDSFLNAQD